VTAAAAAAKAERPAMRLHHREGAAMRGGLSRFAAWLGPRKRANGVMLLTLDELGFTSAGQLLPRTHGESETTVIAQDVADEKIKASPTSANMVDCQQL
jgi:hypothetical protein